MLAIDTTEVDPAEAIESYVEGRTDTDTGSEAGFPWGIAAVLVLLVMVVAVVGLVVFRRRA